MDRFFTSEKRYYSIESFGEEFKALRAYKLIKDGTTEQTEETKIFTSLDDAIDWVNGNDGT